MPKKRDFILKNKKLEKSRGKKPAAIKTVCTNMECLQNSGWRQVGSSSNTNLASRFNAK
jgi:hypothetical protein